MSCFTGVHTTYVPFKASHGDPASSPCAGQAHEVAAADVTGEQGCTDLKHTNQQAMLSHTHTQYCQVQLCYHTHTHTHTMIETSGVFSVWKAPHVLWKYSKSRMEAHIYSSCVCGVKLTGHQVMVRPAKKYPPTVERLVRSMDWKNRPTEHCFYLFKRAAFDSNLQTPASSVQRFGH